MALLRQSTAYTRSFLLVLSSDHLTGATGKSPTVNVSKAGAAFGAAGGVVTEISSGWYKVALTTTDTNTLGDLAYDITAAACDNTDFADQVIAVDLADTVRAGLTALPNAAAGANTGLPVVGTQVPNATAGAANGLLISGANTGPMSISGGTTFSNSTGDALTLSSSGSNGNGLNASGNGTGDGIKATAGATGRGVHAIGGATSGAGLRAEGTAGNANAMELAGQGSAAGLSSTGGATGAGAKFVGGATSGDGIDVTTTSGDGINVTPTGGNALTLTANGTSKHGLVATGGTGGTSDGIKGVAGTGGVDIRGNITGNLSGAVSGSVGSVTGAVGSVTGNLGGNVVGSVGSVVAAVLLSAKDSFVVRNATAQAGAASTITLDASASASDSFYNECEIKIDSGTGAGQVRTITGYVGSTKVATVDASWVTNPDSTSVFTVSAVRAPKIDSSGQVISASVQGNVTGSVGSVTGAVGSVTGTVGSVSGDVSGKVLGGGASSFTAIGVQADTRQFLGQAVTLDAGNLPNVNVSHWAAQAVPTPSVTGMPKVDVWEWVGNDQGVDSGGIPVVALGNNYSPVLHAGVAQAGAAGTITLAAAASADNNAYVGHTITIYASTGAGQSRRITAYNGTTKVATVDANWGTNPANVSQYTIMRTWEPKLDSGLRVTALDSTGAAFTYVAPTNADTSGVTTLLSRVPSALTITGGKVDVNDKTSFALTSAEHTAIAADVQSGLTAQGYTTTRGPKLDNLDAAISSRLAASAAPANWSLMLIDADGRAIVDAHKVHWSISGSTQSIYRADNTTVSYTKTLTTTGGVNPVTGN